MQTPEEIIEQAKKEDHTLKIIKRDARIEERALLKQLNLSDTELYHKIKEINADLSKNHKDTYLYTCHLPILFIHLADLLIAKNYYPNRGELFRNAIRDFLIGFLGVEKIEQLEGQQT